MPVAAEVVGPVLGLVIPAAPDEIFDAPEEVVDALVELVFGLELVLEEDEIFDTLRLEEDEIFDTLRLDEEVALF